MSLRIKRLLADLRSAFEEMYGERLAQMVLFGSQARADADTDSDIDVLVVLKGPVDSGLEIARTGEIVAELSLRFNAVVCCVFMEENRYASRNGPLLRNIRKEGIPV